jgi:glycosyltransferase involved in cell wall biosynthesis
MTLLRRLPDNYLINFFFSFLNGVYLQVKDKKLVRDNRVASKTDNPLVTVYIPTYNRCELLMERGLASALNQTYHNLEIIVADDGSTDQTESLVKGINDPRVVYLKNSRERYRYPNKSIYHWFCGPVEAANMALKHASGDWIARIDDDDYWHHDHIEKLLNFATKNDYEFVSSDLEFRDATNPRVVTPFDDPRDPTGIGATQTWLYRGYLKHITYNIHCWRKRYFRVNDTDLQYRLWKANVRIGYLNEVTAYIEPRPGERYIGSMAYVSNAEFYENFYD